MKIDRLLAIVTVLLQKNKVTSLYLAQKFEVSQRTICRDLEDICKAGIPVVTQQGSGGGIYIEDNYKIDKTLFTLDELQAVFTGLLSLDSVSLDKKYQNIIEKFFPEADKIGKEHILIDLSSHYKNSLAPKIEDLKNAIQNCQCVKFDYYNRSGEKQVKLEPYFVIFQWSSWYAFGYEKADKQFKLFKLNRLCNLEITSENFTVQDVPNEKLAFNKYFTAEILAVIHFNSSQKFKLIEEYGPDSFSVLPNGELKLEMTFTNEEYLISWLLSFGGEAVVMQPQKLREKIKNNLKCAINNYL